MTDAVQRANALDEPIATSIPSIQVLTGTALVACVVFFNEANFRSVDVENFFGLTGRSACVLLSVHCAVCSGALFFRKRLPIFVRRQEF